MNKKNTFQLHNNRFLAHKSIFGARFLSNLTQRLALCAAFLLQCVPILYGAPGVRHTNRAANQIGHREYFKYLIGCNAQFVAFADYFFVQ